MAYITSNQITDITELHNSEVFEIYKKLNKIEEVAMVTK